uniref:RGS domain-containing protein n=1 Tax=Angiostrongylus cantonensis TaxID=6313 RepID=A0A0K0DIS9_ANGCA
MTTSAWIESRILFVFVLANGMQEPIGIQESRAIAHNVDLLLGDPSGLAFFIHYLESCEQLNLIKFWIHIEGYKASFGEQQTVSSQKISSDIFDEARDYVHDLFDSRYFKQFEESVFYKKYQLQVLSRHCGLDDVLHVPSLLNAFLEFVDNRGDHNCLQFLIACHTFETNYRFLSDKEALDDAMSIYDKYISMQAISPLEIDDIARRTMESEICTTCGRPSQMSFYSAKQVCALRIREMYLRKFVRSPGYHNYLIELEADVHNTVRGIYFQCRYSAANDKKSGYFHNDAEILAKLWTRRNLAEVDCMGRYHVLYDDSLAVNKDRVPSRIRQKLRKYLDKATLKEEEVALEVARTIIADVQNMVEAGRK